MDMVQLENREEWLNFALNDVTNAILSALNNGYQPVISLAGGQTPKPLYKAIAKKLDKMVLGRPVLFIVGDERAKPSSAAELNMTMIKESFEPVIKKGIVELHGWNIQAGPEASIEEMADIIRSLAKARDLAKLEHFFDACILGLGKDCHTAGLFSCAPYSDIKSCAYWASAGSEEIAVKSIAPEQPAKRLSLSAGLLASSAKSIFFLQKKGKEEAIARLLRQDPACPAVLAAGKNCIAYVLA
ncbi:hypothetical protein MASR2M29_18440 [Spirochaetota bacterium]